MRGKERYIARTWLAEFQAGGGKLSVLTDRIKQNFLAGECGDMHEPRIRGNRASSRAGAVERSGLDFLETARGLVDFENRNRIDAAEQGVQILTGRMEPEVGLHHGRVILATLGQHV